MIDFTHFSLNCIVLLANFHITPIIIFIITLNSAFDTIISIFKQLSPDLYPNYRINKREPHFLQIRSTLYQLHHLIIHLKYLLINNIISFSTIIITCQQKSNLTTISFKSYTICPISTVFYNNAIIEHSNTSNITYTVTITIFITIFITITTINNISPIPSISRQ